MSEAQNQLVRCFGCKLPDIGCCILIKNRLRDIPGSVNINLNEDKFIDDSGDCVVHAKDGLCKGIGLARS